jgi:hypothetical protein
MNLFFPGFTQFEGQKTFTKVEISQELSGIVQNKNVFLKRHSLVGSFEISHIGQIGQIGHFLKENIFFLKKR